MERVIVSNVAQNRLAAWIMVAVCTGLGANAALGQSYFTRVDPEEATFRLAAAEQGEDPPKEPTREEVEETDAAPAATAPAPSKAAQYYSKLGFGNRSIDDLFNVREAYADGLQGVFSVGARFEYSTTSGQDDDFAMQQSLSYGITDNLSVSLTALQPNLGDGGDSGAGDIEVGLFYQFTQDKDWIPVVSLSSSMRIPSGDGSSGVDGTFNLYVTKSFGDKLRVYMQGFVQTANGSSGASDFDRRHFQWGAGPAVDYLLFDNTVIAMNYLNQSNEEYGKPNENLLQFGLSQNLGQLGNTYHVISFVNTIGLDGHESTTNYEAKLEYTIIF